MPNDVLAPSLPFKLSEYQLAIAVVMEELSNWVEIA